MKKICVLLIVAFLASCTNLHYGNFTNPSKRKDDYLAKNTVNQLARIYPPAKNTLCIRQRVTDGFGMSLVTHLRQRGYGVIENSCPRQQANFFYVLDEPQKHHLYRVSIYINRETLSRLYVKDHGKLSPFSPWSYKE